MANRKNDISLSVDELNDLAVALENTFRSYIYTEQHFSGSKQLDIYNKLQKEIMMVSNISISNSTLRDIMTRKHSGKFRANILGALKKYINAFRLAVNSPELAGRQRVYWGVNQGLPAGAYIENITGEFIEWSDLKKELEARVVSACPRVIPPNSTVITASFYEKKDWVVHIIGPDHKQVGSVWIGSDPLKNWEQDGLVRTGKTISDTEWIVYQIFARFPDGSYRTVKSYV